MMCTPDAAWLFTLSTGWCENLRVRALVGDVGDVGQRNRRRDGGARAGTRADVEPTADDLGAFGHRQQAVAAHLVAAQRMLESVETDSVVDDFETGAVVFCPRRTSTVPSMARACLTTFCRHSCAMRYSAISM